jgi:hypothetical protein
MGRWAGEEFNRYIKSHYYNAETEENTESSRLLYSVTTKVKSCLSYEQQSPRSE